MKRANPYPGLHRSPKKLADGTRRTYFYAWKGGPRLLDDYGSPEFAAAFRDALASRSVRKTGDTLQTLFDAYQKSRGQSGSGKGFLNLDPRTRQDYAQIIKSALEPEFGDFPIAALSDRGARQIFLDWRDTRAAIAPRRADYEFAVLARVLSWSLDRRLILENPVSRAGRVWQGSRREIIWTDAAEEAFLRIAPRHLHLPLQLGIWLGQRQGDILRLPWAAYDRDAPGGPVIRLPQNKGKVRLPIPVSAELRTALDAEPRRSPIILTNSFGIPWTAEGFRKQFRRAVKAAGLTGLTFSDLRGTTVTRLRAAGCTPAQIGAITGHKAAEVNAILEKHYAASDPELGRAAIRKLESREKSPNRPPNRAGGTND